MKHLLFAVWISILWVSCTPNTHRTTFWDEPYHSLAEAETRLANYYDSLDNNTGYNEELVDLILNDPSTLSYPFALLQEYGVVSVATSEDGKLRCYSWDNLSGGTCVSYSNVVQYKSGDKVYAFDRSIFDLMQDESDEESDSGSDVRKIYTLQSDETPVYLVYTFNRVSSNWGYSAVSAVKIVGNKIVSVNLFPDQEDQTSIGAEHTIADWYFAANDGEGWEWLFRFDPNEQTLYVPVAEPELTDRYLLYRFDGKQMVHLGSSGGFWLHPSIRHFNRLVYLFDTDKYRIRVDELDDGTYRYTSWGVGQPMTVKPQIIINKGTMREDDASFIFKNEGYTYIVSADGIIILDPKNRTILQQGRKSS